MRKHKSEASVGSAKTGYAPFSRESWTRRSIIAAMLSIGLVSCNDAAESVAPSQDDFKLAMVGDIIYLRSSLPILEKDSQSLLRILREADAAFGNFESNAFDLDKLQGDKQGPSSGPVVLTSPAAAAELKDMGLDLLSHANNHAFDWKGPGIAATLRTLRQDGFAVAGTGESLGAARAPATYVAHGVRVALVAATTEFPPEAMATDQNVVGAVNGLRLKALDPDAKPGSAEYPDAGSTPYEMNEADRAALLSAISEAKKQNDIVLFSLHTHRPGGVDGSGPPDFEVALAHAAIDAGADVFIAHGPHQLRGVEIYHGKAIFYSLANFAIMQPSPELNPSPLVLPPGSIFTRRAFFESVVATAQFKDGKIHQIELHPFELRNTDQLDTHGLPQPVSAEAGAAILTRMEDLSRPLGTQIERENGVGVITLP